MNKWQAQRGEREKGQLQYIVGEGGGGLYIAVGYMWGCHCGRRDRSLVLPAGLGACEAQPLRFAKALMLIKLIASTCQRQKGQTDTTEGGDFIAVRSGFARADSTK